MIKGRQNKWAVLFVGPALFFTMAFLLYPTINTIGLSFMDRYSENFIGLQNFIYVFTSSTMLTAFRNNVLWLVVFTACTVGIGLLLAIFLDRVPYEKLAKTLIFMPMAISFVGAGVIWKFVYAYRPPMVDQLGILNQVVIWLGGEPIGWLIERPWVNNLALIVVGIWIWTGFCMVILSAAYRGIPNELIEAAKVDGATEWQKLRYIILPSMKPTILVVAVTMIVNVLKIFDIVYVMTNGQFGTEVIANRMYKEMFAFTNFGRASAIATVLFLLIIPVIFFNVKRMKEEEA